jgi:hypothetical protein
MRRSEGTVRLRAESIVAPVLWLAGHEYEPQSITEAPTAPVCHAGLWPSSVARPPVLLTV